MIEVIAAAFATIALVALHTALHTAQAPRRLRVLVSMGTATQKAAADAQGLSTLAVMATEGEH